MTKREIAGRLETLGARMLNLTGLPPTCETFRGLCHLAGQLRDEHAEESDPPAATAPPGFINLLTTLRAVAMGDESPLAVAERLVEGYRELAATRAENDSLRAELSAATEGRSVAGHEHAFLTGGKCCVCGAEYSAGPMAVADLIASVREHEPDPGAELVPNPGQEAVVLRAEVERLTGELEREGRLRWEAVNLHYAERAVRQKVEAERDELQAELDDLGAIQPSASPSGRVTVGGTSAPVASLDIRAGAGPSLAERVDELERLVASICRDVARSGPARNGA